jgi:hypothetical protein
VFIERVRSGEINDLKTLVAGYWFAERQAAGQYPGRRGQSQSPAQKAKARHFVM